MNFHVVWVVTPGIGPLLLCFDAKVGFLGPCFIPIGGALWNPKMILLE